jgi:beta-xylosidase
MTGTTATDEDGGMSPPSDSATGGRRSAGPPPAWDGDFPDPFVLRAGDGYWAYGTNGGGRNVQVLHSADLQAWSATDDALPRLASWARPGFTWAPVVLGRGDGYVLYVTVREPRSDRQALMVASAASPAGPFQPEGDDPLVFQAELGGSIDPSPFVDADGTAYLLWKADANAVGRPSSLWGQALASTGLALVGSPTELLAFDAGWERPLIEAPSIVRDGDRYYLFYSGGWWESDGYAVGYAVAEHPLGPWHKVTDRRPWYASDPAVSGPGGQEWFTDAAGQLWMAYHGWAPGRVGYRTGGRRRLHLVRVSFADGLPVADRPALRPQPVGLWWELIRRLRGV